MEQGMNLHGVVVSKFGSIHNFAKVLDWSYSKTYRAVKNVRHVSIGDANKMSNALNLSDPAAITALFFKCL